MTNRNITKDIMNISLFGMGFFLTFYIVRFFSFQFSTIFAVLAAVSIFCVKGSFRFGKENLLFFLFILIVGISSIMNKFMPLSESYNFKVSLRTLIEYVILYVCASQMIMLTNKELNVFEKGLRWSCIVHISWTLLQFVSYQFADLDINQIILSDLLHMGSNEYGASRYELGKLVLSGLCWHPINLAPTLLLTLMLFNRWYVWLIAFFIAFYSQNGTTMLMLCIFLILNVLCKIKIKKNLMQTRILQKKSIMRFLIIAIILAIIIVQMYPMISNALYDIFHRINSAEDMSTQVHMRYYTAFPFIAKNISFLELLIGCGMGRSGIYISKFFYQYTGIAYWSVESDVMNYVYATGILGFLFFYCWLIVMILKSWKKGRIYSVLIITIIIGGVFYGVQYPWVIHLELIMNVFILKKYPLFSKNKTKFLMFSNTNPLST